MEKVTMYKTADGQVHASVAKAKSHVDKQYGSLMHEISAALGDLKYGPRQFWIDENLHLFSQLIALKADLDIQVDEDTDCDR